MACKQSEEIKMMGGDLAMIDLHSHVLPGIDDGSRDPEMSQKMLEMLAGQGVTAVMATPHFYAAAHNPEDFVKQRTEVIARLQQTPIPVLAGAEVAYFDGMSRADVLPKLCLGDSRLLLVEMPYGPWTPRMIEEVCDLPMLQGVIPVLAHVDRYRGQFTKYMPDFMQHGVLFQCNAEAFLNWRSRCWALELLREGALHFLGSDCHNLTTRAPKMAQAAQVITQKLGKEVLEDLTAFTAELLHLTDN